MPPGCLSRYVAVRGGEAGQYRQSRVKKAREQSSPVCWQLLSRHEASKHQISTSSQPAGCTPNWSPLPPPSSYFSAWSRQVRRVKTGFIRWQASSAPVSAPIRGLSSLVAVSCQNHFLKIVQFFGEQNIFVISLRSSLKWREKAFWPHSRQCMCQLQIWPLKICFPAKKSRT